MITYLTICICFLPVLFYSICHTSTDPTPQQFPPAIQRLININPSSITHKIIKKESLTPKKRHPPTCHTPHTLQRSTILTLPDYI